MCVHVVSEESKDTIWFSPVQHTHHMQDHSRQQESVVGELVTERKGRKRVREAMFAIKNASFSPHFRLQSESPPYKPSIHYLSLKVSDSHFLAMICQDKI